MKNFTHTVLSNCYAKINKTPVKLGKKFFRNIQTNNKTAEPIQMACNIYYPQSPPLIILHGLYGSKSNFGSFARNFMKRSCPCRIVYSADMRNHGQSPHHSSHDYEHLAADIKEMVDKLSLSRITLMGHSMGGRAVMLFALKYPNLIEKAIVIDISPVNQSYGVLDEAPDLLKALKNCKFPTGGSLSDAINYVDMQLEDKIPNKWLRQFLLTNVRQFPDRSFRWRINIDALIKEHKKYSTFPDVSNMAFNGPVLFIIGDNSEFVPESHYPSIRNTFTKAEFVVISNCGHLVHIEQPEKFLSLCLEFLNKV